MKIKLLIILILCISLVTANDLNKIICDDTYYFLLKGLEDNHSIAYSNYELENLTNQLSINTQTNIELSTTEYFIRNFDSVCNKPLVFTQYEDISYHFPFFSVISWIVVISLFIFLFKKIRKAKDLNTLEH